MNEIALSIGELVVTGPRTIHNTLDNLNETSNPEIFADSTGEALIKFLRFQPQMQNDIVATNSHVRKHCSSSHSEDQIQKLINESIINEEEQIICSIWLDEFASYLSKLLSDADLLKKLQIHCINKRTNVSDIYTFTKHVFRKFTEIAFIELNIKMQQKLPTNGQFLFIDTFKPTKLFTIAFNAHDTLRENPLTRNHGTNITSQTLGGYLNAIDRFISAYQAHIQMGGNNENWQQTMVKVHDDAKLNMHNVRDSNSNRTNQDGSYNFDAALEKRQGERTTITCTARIGQAFNVLGRDIPKIMQLSKYLYHAV